MASWAAPCGPLEPLSAAGAQGDGSGDDGSGDGRVHSATMALCDGGPCRRQWLGLGLGLGLGVGVGVGLGLGRAAGTPPPPLRSHGRKPPPMPEGEMRLSRDGATESAAWLTGGR